MNAATPCRDDAGTMSVAGAASRCPVCARAFTRNGRRAYCSTACRKRAYRRRRGFAAAASVPTGARRRDHTVYECPACGERRLGEQRCEQCGTFGRTAGLGGACPHCAEPVTVAELGLNLEAGR